MQSLYDLSAPAKLNLFLHVTGRRTDGYHLIESVFMLIDWCDTLHMSRRDDGSISREDLGAALPADDLVLRAARALQVASGCQYGAHIGIDKRIPAQAGMGGGSSDAATTLLALNRLWHLNWPLEKLLPIGLRLGADVPFFLHGHNAWVSGIGEIIEAVELPEAEFLVAKPGAGLSTSAIFCHSCILRVSGGHGVIKSCHCFFEFVICWFGKSPPNFLLQQQLPPTHGNHCPTAQRTNSLELLLFICAAAARGVRVIAARRCCAGMQQPRLCCSRWPI
jgi:4-diphosphocytidyl-2-C-methyl-D-erythritol kinase